MCIELTEFKFLVWARNDASQGVRVGMTDSLPHSRLCVYGQESKQARIISMRFGLFPSLQELLLRKIQRVVWSDASRGRKMTLS